MSINLYATRVFSWCEWCYRIFCESRLNEGFVGDQKQCLPEYQAINVFDFDAILNRCLADEIYMSNTKSSISF